MCVGGGSHNEGINSSDLDLLSLIPAKGIDLSGVMGIYTNTSTKKKLKDIIRHYQLFTRTFWLSPKQSCNIRNLSWLEIMYKRINIPPRQHKAICLAILLGYIEHYLPRSSEGHSPQESNEK